MVGNRYKNKNRIGFYENRNSWLFEFKLNGWLCQSFVDIRGELEKRSIN